MDQITYLEKLLEGYRERFKRGETNFADRIRVTAAKLDELKLKQHYEEQRQKDKQTTPKFSILKLVPRGCCRGR
jgi:hypothetical protein